MTKQIVTRILGLAVVAGISAAGLLAGGVDDPTHVKRLRDTKACDGCNFQDAKLMALDAQLASLKKADFRGANLYKANFREADLTGAQFGGANLSRADLTGAKGANLAGATTDAETKCPNGAAGPCGGS